VVVVVGGVCVCDVGQDRSALRISSQPTEVYPQPPAHFDMGERKVHEATGQRPPAKRLVSLTPPDQHLTGAMIAAMKATERADGERVVSPLHSIGCLVLYAHWTGWV
jgi:hypothetical protein